MSQWQRGICKIGLTIQGFKDVTGSAWGSEIIANALQSVPNNASVSLPAYDLAAPCWYSKALEKRMVSERTKMWGYSRYPYSTGGGYYDIEYDLRGSTNHVEVAFQLMGIWRASDKGIDQGASYGYIYWRNFEVYDTAGVRQNTWSDDSAAELKFSEANMMSYTLGAGLSASVSKPIGRVYVRVELVSNVYSAHDVGDRSPATGFNPSLPLGAYYPRNLNEISSDGASTKLDPASGYLRPYYPQFWLSAGWRDFGKIMENVTHTVANCDIGVRPFNRTFEVHNLVLQGYKDKYSPHATIHVRFYLKNGATYELVSDTAFYPRGADAVVVNSGARIVKKTFSSVTFPIPAGRSDLVMYVVATNSNEEATSVGWDWMRTVFA